MKRGIGYKEAMRLIEFWNWYGEIGFSKSLAVDFGKGALGVLGYTDIFPPPFSFGVQIWNFSSNQREEPLGIV